MSVAESAEPKAAASYRLSELQVLKQGSTVHSIHWRGWSTSTTDSADPKAAPSDRLSEVQVLKLGRTLHSTHWRDGQRPKQEVQNRKLRQATSFRVAGTNAGE